MVITQVESEIHQPVSIVFEYVRNFENMPNYNSSVLFAKWLDISFTTCHVKIGLSILQFEGEYKIVELVQDKKIVANCKTNLIEFEDVYEFENLENATKLIITDSTQLKGFLALSESILRPNMKREMEANMRTLKKNLEKRGH